MNSLDRERLYDAIPFTIPLVDHLSELFRLLAVATPLPPQRVPPSLVTMNSVVCIRDADSGKRGTFDLVYPIDSNHRPWGRSVVAPFGAAIFGRFVGERVSWRTPRGERCVVIEALQYQPERQGHYDR
ncbi:MAG: GreA/GreB family elongation factor [Phycisphaeraceae bacterium]|nr:GreA/GreB family elongation factor [Phycisphaeraceae bacterium]